jgi:phosphoglycerol transferase MdoB-like AlkP superfamily enzyme
MVSALGLQPDDSGALNYERKVIPTDTFTQKPNIILVICESFSAYKSSMYGNPLNTTPYFNEMCKQGVFFDRCFTPAFGTARGVWATITGIPDVESPRTASRNPGAVDQHTIINNFRGYEHSYFLGGDPTWANIQGLLSNNINGLKIYSQDNFKAKKVDVWGISDKNLFLEANGILKEKKGPFFAIIQTADNHRPFTIPAEDKAEFNFMNVPESTLKKAGFESNEELNAFRFTDFCFRKFMEAAKREKYFDNSIFVFVGDHGIRGNAADMFPKSWTAQGLTCEHVPLLFYAPKYIAPKRIHEVCSQVDILPSIASLAKMTYRNNTFGRDLFDTMSAGQFKTVPAKQHYAFIIDHDVKTIGLVSDQYYFLKNLKTGLEEFVSVTGNEIAGSGPREDSIKNQMNIITDAWYETAKYLLLNNKKKN